MEKVHEENIFFLKKLFSKQRFDWIDYNESIFFNFFKSGGGTHLYLIENSNQKYLARINYNDLKNTWGTKKQEFEVLKLIEPLHISPKVYFFSNSNSIKQDFTIVEYIDGEPLGENISQKNITDLAQDLQKLHMGFPMEDELPYYCDIYNEFANGEDKKIEKYASFEGVEKIIEPYNRINKRLGTWFNSLDIFAGAREFSLCHADLKKENILVTKTGVKLIDWECAGSDIPETDIGRLFSGCVFSNEQQTLFLKTYYGKIPDKLVMERILAVKKVLDFFRILEDYIILKRKKWNAENMLRELLEFERQLEGQIK